jgi:hypothetical protein
MTKRAPTPTRKPDMHQPKPAPMRLAIRAAATLALGIASLTPAHALEGYTFWDNFDGAAAISPALWQGRERSRMIEGGALRMIQRDLGSQHSDAGLFSTSWSTQLRNPAAIGQLRATVTVSDFQVSGCAGNPTPSTVQARLMGFFFNAGPGVPTSRVNDVGALIRFKRDSNSADAAGLLRVEGVVVQCTTTDCNYDATLLGSVDLGIATVGQAAVLKLEWDAPNKRFNFLRDSNPVQRISYSASDALPPSTAYRDLSTRMNLANCLAGARTEGYMDAKFDNVYVNASAVTP